MPRALCDVWRHFTATNVEGKVVYICKYCAKLYGKNATKMQNHLAKCIKFPQCLQQAISDKSPSTSIRGENNESDTLSIATAQGPPGIRIFWTQWRNAVREMLMKWPIHRQCVLGDIYKCSSPSIHPTNQTCFIYSFARYRVQQSSSEGQENHRESRLYCNHLWWVVECLWARNN